MSTCLVTGGAGFIGCAISEALTQDFEQVVAFDNLHPQVHPRSVRPAALHPQVELIAGDVSQADDWDHVLSQIRPDVIFHLAAETGTGQSLLEATRHSTVNVVGTTQLTDALARHGIKPRRIVLTSSRAVYGEGRWQDDAGQWHYPGMRTHEMLENSQWDFPGLRLGPHESSQVSPAPANVYAATKLCQESLLRSWCGSMGVDLQVLRLQNVYGPGQSLTNSYTGIVSLFARWARAGKTIPVYEDGQIIRDFVYISDVAAAVLAAGRTAGTNPHPYDIGTGQATTILELARLIAAHYGAPDPVTTGQYRDGDVRGAWADPAPAKRALGWQAQVPLAQGLSQLCQWIDGQESPVEPVAGGGNTEGNGKE